jgi:flagellar motor switch protein FliM
MEKVLNQEEIDAMVRLARGKSPESSDASGVKPWNFLEAGQIGREPLRAITQLHEVFARNLTHSLGAYLRVVFDVNLVSVEQLGYNEFLARLPEQTYLATTQLQPVNATSALQLDLTLAFPIIDLLLGGFGTPESELRDITDIEEQILEGVVRVMCRELESAWQPVGISCSFEQRQQPAQMQRLMPPNEKTLSLSFEIRMPESRGMLNLVCPSSVSNILLRKLAHNWAYRRPKGLSECSPELLARILDCNFNTELSLAPQYLDARRVVNLSPGESLALSQPVDQPALLMVANQPCFNAEIVRRGSRRAGHILVRHESQPVHKTT